MKTAD